MRKIPFICLVLLAGCGQGLRVDEMEVSLSPLSGKQGETLTLFIDGVGTRFAQSGPDPLVAISGEADGVVTGHVVVDNEHRARFPLHIASSAAVTGSDGSHVRSIAVTSGGRTWDFDFSVNASPSLPRIGIDPDSGVAGTSGVTVDVLSTSPAMSFGEDTVVTFTDDSGVHVDASEVTGPSHVRLEIHIDDDAPEGLSSVTVTTAGDVATHPFEVHAMPDTRLWAIPAEAHQDTTLSVNLVVEGLTLNPGDLTVELPYNPLITVSDVTWASASSGSATIAIASDAPAGPTQILVRSGSRTASSTFKVLPTTNTEPFLRLSPAVVEQGATLRDVFITGVYTGFSASGSELAVTPGDGIAVDGFWVIDDAQQRAVARLTVDADADLGSSVVTIATGEQSAQGVLTVIRSPALAVRLVPSTVIQGDTDLVVGLFVEGADLLSASSLEVFFPVGAGLGAGEISVVSSSQATIAMDVTPTAPTGSTLLTLDVDGQTASAPLVVLASDSGGSFTIQPPFLSIPSGEVTIGLEGTGTDWRAGEVTLRFSDPSIEVLDFDITGPTEATATVRGPAWITSRRVVAYMASTSSLEAAWWTMLTTSYRDVRFFPDTIEAGDKINVLAVGNSTAFLDGLTMGILPPSSGLGAGAVTVYDPDLAIVELQSSPEASPGLYGLTLVTGGEVGLGSIRVTEPALAVKAKADPGVIVVEASTTVRITSGGASFDSTTVVSSPVHGLVPGAPSVIDPGTMEVSLFAHSGMNGQVVPLTLETGADVRRACVAMVLVPGQPHAHFSPVFVPSSSTATLTVESLGTPPIDFGDDPPEISAASTGVAISGSRRLSASTMEVDVQVADASLVMESVVLIRLAGTRYDWLLVVPVLDPPLTLTLESGSDVASGVVGGTLEIESQGFGLFDASLRAAAPSLAMFVESIQSTGASSARVVYDAPVHESVVEATLYAMPEPSAWAMPVPLSLMRAPLRVVGIPSRVLESVPADGPDLVGFTPAADATLILWTVQEGGLQAVPWIMLGQDGISVTGRPGHGGIMALPDTSPERRYASVGEADTSGTSYWLSVLATLSGVDRIEVEPNDSLTEARGLGGPGLPSSVLLASIGDACDVDFYEIAPGPVTCFEVVSTRWAAGTFSSPFVSLTLLDETGAEVDRVTGGDGHMDPVICTEGEPGATRYLRVLGLAGTGGPYLLVPRWPVLINELDNGPFSGRWIEIQGPEATSLAGWTIEILDGVSGSSRGLVDLSPVGTMPAGGIVLVAAPSAPVTADLTSAVLDQMIVPYAVRLCHSGRGTCDTVQVGTGGSYGEGDPLDPAALPAGRLWSIDTQRNLLDFVPFVQGTPGEPGGLPEP